MTKLALTPERRKIIDAARDEWMAIGLSTAPADFDAAEVAVTTLYEGIGKKRPYFVRLSSPFGAQLYRTTRGEAFMLCGLRSVFARAWPVLKVAVAFVTGCLAMLMLAAFAGGMT